MKFYSSSILLALMVFLFMAIVTTNAENHQIQQRKQPNEGEELESLSELLFASEIGGGETASSNVQMGILVAAPLLATSKEEDKEVNGATGAVMEVETNIITKEGEAQAEKEAEPAAADNDTEVQIREGSMSKIRSKGGKV